MPFRDGALAAVCMLNVLHHVPDVRALFAELVRCLAPDGRVWMREPHPGFPGKLVFRYLHHEPWDADTRDWSFPSSGPLSSANQALPWLVFVRDRATFERDYPQLQVVSARPHSPFRYWLSGGLSRWSLTPTERTARWAARGDALLSMLSPRLSSFVDIEIRRA
jgi:SAM-dependent methyltransferase